MATAVRAQVAYKRQTPGGAALIHYAPEGERFAKYVWLWANAVRRIGYENAPEG